MHETTDPADIQPDDRLRELARLFAAAYERFRRDVRAVSDGEPSDQPPAREEVVKS